MSKAIISDLRQQRLERAVAEYLQAVDRGEHGDRNAWLMRYSDLNPEFAAFVEDHAQLDRLVAPLRSDSLIAPSTLPNVETHQNRALPNDTPRFATGRVNTSSRVTADAEMRSPPLFQFGDYEILEEIAFGGMGIVYKARQQSLGRTVAVKTIRSGHRAGKEELLRFRLEAEATAQLSHPNIVPIYEVGVENGLYYFSMEYIDGPSLRDLVIDNPLPPREAAQFVEKVARAIGCAHEKGIIHRDLKPANILIDLRGEPRITDFGLAKQLTLDMDITATGNTLGTPAYMSPEQITGRADPIGPSSDIYSLGATLFCLLTGHPPFQAATNIETIHQATSCEPVPLRTLNVSIPADLETICLKCLRKEPHRRYATASELADDLQHWLKGEPIIARPVSRLERAWMWIVRNRAVTGSLTAIVLTVLVATGMIAAQLQMNRFAKLENDYDRARTLVQSALTAPAEELPYLLDSLEPLREHAEPLLREQMTSATGDPTHRLHAVLALARFGKVEHQLLAKEIAHSSPHEASNIVAALRLAGDAAVASVLEEAARADELNDWRHKARLAIIAMHLGEVSISRAMCQLKPDPIQRTVFIDTLSDWHEDMVALARVANRIDDGPLRTGLCLGVGRIPSEELTIEEKQIWQAILSDWYQNQPDAGTHSAAGWALRNWQASFPQLETAKGTTAKTIDWCVNSIDLTMLKVPAGTFVRSDFRPQTFASDGTSHEEIVEQRVTLTRSFLLSDRLISRSQFQQFIDDPHCPEEEKPSSWVGAHVGFSVSGEHPIQEVSWYDAVMFCNWLSRRESFSPCYQRNGSRWSLLADADGYRLPTEAEWEYACRAGSATRYTFGDDASFLHDYAVFHSNTTEISGSKLPNGWGFFDVHGNLDEWCHDGYAPFGSEAALSDPVGPDQVPKRVLRGSGAFTTTYLGHLTSSARKSDPPNARYPITGFRVARTHLDVIR